MPICPASSGLVHGLVDSVDCHIRVFVHDAYRELVGPGTPFVAAFTAMLTIYIALIGYQMLLGRGSLRLTVLPVIALKIGLIMAFLTSWAAYQTVIFSLLFDGPREILGALLTPLRGSGIAFEGDVYDGVESAYAVLSGAASIYGGQANPAANILQGGPMLGAGLLWLAAIGLLLVTVGAILATKIVLGFLLAVGPIFVALFLFDTTRGFFDGWLRAAVAFAVTPLAVNVFGAAMLIMMAPFLNILTENASAGTFDMGPIVTIGLIVIVFAVVMVLALRAAAAIASGFSTLRVREGGMQNFFMEPRGAVAGVAPAAAVSAAERSIADAERTSTFVRRTEVMRETWAADSYAGFERLGQAYRRGARAAIRNVGGGA